MHKRIALYTDLRDILWFKLIVQKFCNDQNSCGGYGDAITGVM